MKIEGDGFEWTAGGMQRRRSLGSPMRFSRAEVLLETCNCLGGTSATGLQPLVEPAVADSTLAQSRLREPCFLCPLFNERYDFMFCHAG